MRWGRRTRVRLALVTCLLVTLFLLRNLSLWKAVNPNFSLRATSKKETWARRASQTAGEKAELKADVPRRREQVLTARHHDDLKSYGMRHSDQHVSALVNGLRYHRGYASNERRYRHKNAPPAKSDTSLAGPERNIDSTSPTRSGHDPGKKTSSSRHLPVHIQSDTSSTILKHDRDGVTSTRAKLDQDRASLTKPRYDPEDTSPGRPQPVREVHGDTSSSTPNDDPHDSATLTKPNLYQARTSLAKPGHAQNSTFLALSQGETVNSSTHYQNKSTREGDMQSNDSLFEKWTREQELTKRHVQETCTSLRTDSRAADLTYELTAAVRHTLNHLLVVDSHKIIYCYIPKVGCTSWKRILLVLLEKFKRVEDVSHIGAHYTPIPNLSKFTLDGVKQRLTNYTTFLITRDPFKRVVSCFRDKFEKDTPDSRALQRNVMRGIQGNSGNYSKSDKFLPKVDFPQFARYVADPRNTFDHYGPTEHWNEAYRLCHPCLVRYDYIGEFDTLTRDSQLILKATGLDNTVGFPGATNPTNSSGDAVNNKYLSLLNKTEITALNKRYEIDSELFGYSKQPVPG